MHGSPSPVRKGLWSHSRGPHPFHVTRARTGPGGSGASVLAGSRPIPRSTDRTCIVESHPRFQAAPPHRPSAAWRATSRLPAPSVATRERSAATSSAGASVRSRITCQRTDGSESSSQSTTVTDFPPTALAEATLPSLPSHFNALSPSPSIRWASLMGSLPHRDGGRTALGAARHAAWLAPAASRHRALFHELGRSLASPRVDDQLAEKGNAGRAQTHQHRRKAVVVRLGEEGVRVGGQERRLLALVANPDCDDVGARLARFLRLESLHPYPHEALLLPFVLDAEGEAPLCLTSTRQRRCNPSYVFLIRQPIPTRQGHSNVPIRKRATSRITFSTEIRAGRPRSEAQVATATAIRCHSRGRTLQAQSTTPLRLEEALKGRIDEPSRQLGGLLRAVLRAMVACRCLTTLIRVLRSVTHEEQPRRRSFTRRWR